MWACTKEDTPEDEVPLNTSRAHDGPLDKDEKSAFALPSWKIVRVGRMQILLTASKKKKKKKKKEKKNLTRIRI